MRRGVRYLAGMAAVACSLIVFSLWAASLGTWHTAAPMPLERTEVATAALDGKIYVIGGFKKFFIGGVADAVQMYDPTLDRWEDRAALPQALHHVAAAGIDGKLYVVGGYLRICLGNRWPAFGATIPPPTDGRRVSRCRPREARWPWP